MDEYGKKYTVLPKADAKVRGGIKRSVYLMQSNVQEAVLCGNSQQFVINMQNLIMKFCLLFLSAIRVCDQALLSKGVYRRLVEQQEGNMFNAFNLVYELLQLDNLSLLSAIECINSNSNKVKHTNVEIELEQTDEIIRAYNKLLVELDRGLQTTLFCPFTVLTKARYGKENCEVSAESGFAQFTLRLTDAYIIDETYRPRPFARRKTRRMLIINYKTDIAKYSGYIKLRDVNTFITFSQPVAYDILQLSRDCARIKLFDESSEVSGKLTVQYVCLVKDDGGVRNSYHNLEVYYSAKYKRS